MEFIEKAIAAQTLQDDGANDKIEQDDSRSMHGSARDLTPVIEEEESEETYKLGQPIHTEDPEACKPCLHQESVSQPDLEGTADARDEIVRQVEPGEVVAVSNQSTVSNDTAREAVENGVILGFEKKPNTPIRKTVTFSRSKIANSPTAYPVGGKVTAMASRFNAVDEKPIFPRDYASRKQ